MKSKNTSVPIIIIEKLFDFLKGLSLNELSEISEGKKDIKFSIEDKEAGKSKLTDERVTEKMNATKDKLFNTSSREEGLQLLADNCPNRSDLEALAKIIDIPVTKRDNIEHIKEKIIEATIGYRLSSKAILGKTTS